MSRTYYTLVRHLPAVLLVLLVVSCVRPSRLWAGSVETLPQGVFRVRVRPTVIFFSHRFDRRGRAEPLTADLDNVVMDNTVFSDLAELERIYNMPDGTLNVGRSHLRTQVVIQAYPFALEYGVTDNLTVGLVVPYVHAHQRLTRLRLDPGNIGHNPGDGRISADDAAYLPLNHDKDPTTRHLDPLDRDDVRRILRDDFHYRWLDDSTTHGVGDIEVGAKYRFPAVDFWRSSLQLGLRAPTGKTVDPHDLLGLGLGSGAFGILLAVQQDFIPWDRLRFNLTLRYTANLPQRIYLRVPTRFDRPITDRDLAERVWRNIGDVFTLDTRVTFALLEFLIPHLRYAYVHKLRDEVFGVRGLSYESLEILTDGRSHLLEAGLTFTTVPWALREAFPVPFDVTLSYERAIAGSHRAIISNMVALNLAVYFKVF